MRSSFLFSQIKKTPGDPRVFFEAINESRIQRITQPLIYQRLHQCYSEVAPLLAPLKLSENN